MAGKALGKLVHLSARKAVPIMKNINAQAGGEKKEIADMYRSKLKLAHRDIIGLKINKHSRQRW